MSLTKLQQRMFDAVSDEIDEVEVTKEDIIRDIKRMNAAELRHQIKLFEEVNEDIIKYNRVRGVA